MFSAQVGSSVKHLYTHKPVGGAHMRAALSHTL